MANLTAAQYKSEMDNARKKYVAGSLAYLDRGAAWGEIAGVYSLLWVHQLVFDDKGATPSATALGYRTDAENLLNNAKAKLVGFSVSSASAVASTNMASAMAFAYVQMTKREAGLADGA
jgi:hypothetical protein